MWGHRMRILALAVVMAAFVAPAQAERFKVGSWVGKSYNDKSGQFVSCSMAATYKSGITMMFTITKAYEWGITLHKADWDLVTDRRVNAALLIDDYEPIVVQGVVTSRTTITAPLKNSNRVVNAMRRGYVMRIKTKDGVEEFSLKGTYNAIARLSKCVANQIAVSRHVSDNAFAGAARDADRPAASRQGYERIDKTTATIFVSNLMSSAGITGFEILPPSQNILKSFDVVWRRPDGIIGGFNGFRNVKHLNLDAEAARMMSGEAATCNSDLASGKKRAASKNGIEIRRIFVACRNSDFDFETHYTLVKTPGGTIIQLAHGLWGKAARKPAPAPVGDADRALIQSANWSQLD